MYNINMNKQEIHQAEEILKAVALLKDIEEDEDFDFVMNTDLEIMAEPGWEDDFENEEDAPKGFHAFARIYATDDHDENDYWIQGSWHSGPVEAVEELTEALSA